MKKILAIFILSILISTVAIAQNTTFETFESIFYIKAKHTLPVNTSKELKAQFFKGEFDSALVSFLKECQPYEENIDAKIMGFDFTINIKSNGIINKKCEYNISGKINNIEERTRDELNIYIPNSEIAELEPKIECSFDKEQLVFLIDTISDRNNSSDLAIKHSFLKSNKNIYPKLDEKLISMFQKEQVCQMVNKEEIINKLNKMNLRL